MPTRDNRPSDPRQPNLFILGAPKCGTTSLASWLGSHPEIYSSPVKEPHHYNTDEKQRYYPDREHYLSLFDGADPRRHRYLLEASVWYLHSEEAVPNILRDCPEARFIVCVRNPVDMAFALHGQYLNVSNNEHVSSFRKAWDLSDERLQGRQVNKFALEPRYLAYKYSCRIGMQSERLLTWVRRENVHFVVMDDLARDSEKVLGELLDFLGLKKDVELRLKHRNKRKDLKWPAMRRFIKHGGRVKSRMGLRNVSFGLSGFTQKVNASSQPKRMAPELRRELTGYFEDEIRTLWRIIGREYPEWLDIR